VLCQTPWNETNPFFIRSDLGTSSIETDVALRDVEGKKSDAFVPLLNSNTRSTH
jgi:hypothetical protein